MKIKPAIHLSFPLASAIAALLAGSGAHASNLYWDTDAATAGAGGATPNGAWTLGGTTWSTSPNGTLATAGLTTSLLDDLFFSAGVTATGAYAITLNDSQDAKSLTFRSGTATISGADGVVNLGGTGIINVTNSLLAAPNSAVIGANTNTYISGSAGLTKTGVGTLTLNGTAANTFTGGLNVNGGILALNFANMATPTDLINSGNALTLGGGNLSITSKTGAFTTNQTFGNVTINSGGGSLLVNPNTGTATNITLGTLTSTASGGSLLIGRALSAGTGTLSIATTSNVDATGIYGGRTVFANGTANTGYDWATNTGGSGPAYTLSAYTGYAALALGVGTDTANSRITANQTMTGSRTTNSLKFENPATAQTLTIGAGNTLTLTSGGLLFTGTAANGPKIGTIVSSASVGNITAGNGSGSYDLVVHQYSASSSIAIGSIGSTITNNVSINSNIVNNGSNAVTLVKNGSGGLVVGGTANTFTGGIIVNEGNLAFNSATAINNNAMTFNANSIVHTFGGSSTSGNITLNNSSQVTILNNNSSFTVTGDVTGSGGISAANGGQGAITLNLNGTGNNFTGPVRFTANNGTQAATINVGSLADTDTFGSGNITFGAGSATPTGNTFGLSSNAVAVTLTNRRFEMAGDLVVHQINNASANALTINSNLLVTGSRAKSLTLGGAGAGLSTFAGAISNHTTPTAAGTVPIAVRTTGVVNAGGAITLGSVEGIVAGAAISGTGIAGGTTIATVNPFTRQVTLSANTTGAIAIGTNFTIPNVVNSVSVNKNDAGTWVISGDNSYTGPTNITAGTLNIRNANALGGTGVGTQVANAATLSLQGGFSYAAEPLTLTPGGGGSPMLLNVSGLNTWNGPITSNTATSSNVSRVQSDLGTMTLAGSATLSGSAHQFVFQGDGAITVSGQITGVGRVTSGTTGTGIRTLSNDTNNYTGATNVNGGILAFTSIENVGATSSALGAPVLADATIQLASVATAGTLRYVGTAPGGHTSNRVINLASTTGAPTIEANGAGPLVLTSPFTATGAGSKTLTLSGANIGDNTIGGAIVNNSATNTTSVNKDGAGKWILSGANTHSGTTTVSAGILALGNNLALQNSALVTTGGGNVTLGAGITTPTIGGLSGATGDLATVISSGYNLVTALTLNPLVGSVTYGGAIADGATGMTLTKTGGGTQVLTGTNGYTGATSVSAGTLVVNGSLANTTTTVSGTGTLKGSGAIGGSVTIQSGGTLASGTSIESLATGDLSFTTASTFQYELDKDATAGVEGDLTAVSGNLSLAGTVNLALVETGIGSWELGNPLGDHFGSPAADKLTLIAYTGTWNSGLFTYLGNLIPDDSVFILNGQQWFFNYNDTDAGTNFTGDLSPGMSYVTMTVPEPGAALLGGLGLLALLRRRR